MSASSLIRRIGYRVRSAPRTPKEADRLLLLNGTLQRIGWTRSVRSGRPVTMGGSPLPWLTYAAIHWLDSSLRGDERVFEFGSGSSTAWLAERVAHVESVEHNSAWFAEVTAALPDNASLSLRSEAEYARAISGHGPLDLVLVDGIDRSSCVRLATHELTNEGAIIIDNSDRRETHDVINELSEQGFSRIDFVGPAPGLTNFSCTSVLSCDLTRWSAQKLPMAWGSSHALRGRIDPIG